jgi:hypothetical protein
MLPIDLASALLVTYVTVSCYFNDSYLVQYLLEYFANLCPEAETLDLIYVSPRTKPSVLINSQKFLDV